MRKIVAVITAILLLGVPTSLASWASRGQKEPDTLWDLHDGMMHLSNDTRPDTRSVYLNVFPVNGVGSGPLSNPNIVALRTQLPNVVTAFNAMMGVWKDCNRDGYIGNLESLQYVYPTQLLQGDYSVCPLNYGSPTHNNGTDVREFFPIGPACNLEEQRQGKEDWQCIGSPHVLHDDDAKVWGDYGTPQKLRTTHCPGLFLPQGSLSTLGAIIRYGDCELTNVPGWELTRQNPIRDGKSNPCLEPNRQYHIVLPGNAGTLELAEVCNYPNPYSAGEDRSAIVFKCGTAYNVQGPDGRTLWTVPGPDFGSLWSPNVPTVDPDGSGQATGEHIFGDCMGQPPQNYDMYAALERDRPNDGTKRFTDWEFVFYEGGEDDTAAIKNSIYGTAWPSSRPDWLFGGLDDFPMWVGTRSDAVWTNPYFDWETKQPADVQNFTFYGKIGYAAQSRYGLRFPVTDFAYYLNEPCPTIYDVYGRVDCRPERWWRGEAQPHQAVPREWYRLRDVDCYDPYPPGVPRPPTSGICDRPDPLLMDIAAGVDYNQDCLGDQWQSEFRRYLPEQRLPAPFEDLDGDTADNLAEFRWRTIPIPTDTYFSSWQIMGVRAPLEVPSFLPGAQDYDRDWLQDGHEIRYWGGDTKQGQDCRSPTAVSLFDPQSFLDIDEDGKASQHDDDSDGDNLNDSVDWTYAYPELQDSDCPSPTEYVVPCPPAYESKYDPQRTEGHGLDPNAHGDKLPDREEFDAWKAIDAEVRAQYPNLVTGTPWRWDIDGDGIGGKSTLLDRDSDGDGLLDGDEWPTWKTPSARTTSSSAMHWFDTDRDGLLDGASIKLWPEDPRNRIWTDAGVASCVPPNEPYYTMYLGEREYPGSLPNRADNPGTPVSGCGPIANSAGSPLWIAYTRLPDGDVPSAEREDFVRQAVEQGLHDGEEVLANVTTLADRCLAYTEYVATGTTDPAPLAENVTVCADDARDYVKSLLVRTLEPTPVGPLASDTVLLVDDAIARAPDLTSCLPQELALPPAEPDLGAVECSAEAVVAYTEWLVDRATRFVTSTLDSTIQATPLGPLVDSATQTVNGIASPIASTERIVHTVDQVVQNPWSAADIVLGEAMDVAVRTPGDVASVVLNVDNSSDPSQSFTYSLVGPTGLGQHWEAVRSSPVSGGIIGAVDSLVYGVHATSGTHSFTRREQLDRATSIDLDANGVAEYTLTFALNSEVVGGTLVVSPAIDLTRNPASTYAYAQPFKVFVYYFPAGSPYVLTLAASAAPDSMPQHAKVSLAKFVPQKARDRVLELTASTTASSALTLHAAAGGFEVDSAQRPVPGNQVLLQAESLQGPASFRVKTDKVTSTSHALTLEVAADGASKVRAAATDGETVPSQNRQVRLDMNLSATLESPTTLVRLQATDLDDKEAWNLVGTAATLQVDHADVVDGVPSAFALDADGATAASAETTQSAVSAQRASHTGGSVSWLHAYGTKTCPSAQTGEFARFNWKSGVYCSTGRLAGTQSTTVTIVEGEISVEAVGTTSVPFLYQTDVDDIDEYGAALYVTGLSQNGKVVGTIHPLSRTASWDAATGTTTGTIDFAAAFPTQSGMQRLAFGGSSFPAHWEATAQADHFALDANAPPTAAWFSFAPNGAAVRKLAGVDHVSLKGQSSSMAGSARLDHFPSFQATLSGATMIMKGATDATSTVRLRFADAASAKAAGVVTVTPGTFDLTAAVAADGVLNVITAPTATSVMQDIEIGGPLGTHDVYLKAQGSPTAFNLRANPAAGEFEASADARLSILELSYAPKGTGKPTLGQSEQIILRRNAQGVASAAVKLADVDSARLAPVPTGVQLDLAPASSAKSGTALLVTSDRSIQLDYVGRPTQARAVFPAGKATLTTVGATGAIDAVAVDAQRSSSLQSATGEGVDVTWSQGASSFAVSFPATSTAFTLEDVMRATESQAGTAWRLESGAGSPAVQLALDDQTGIVSLSASGGQSPFLGFQRALGSDRVPFLADEGDHVAVKVGTTRETTLSLHQVATITVRPSRGDLLPILEFDGQAGTPLLVDIRQESNGQTIATAHAETSSRPSSWDVIGDLAATSFHLDADASGPVGPGDFGFKAAGRWLTVAADLGTEDLTVDWSENGELTVETSRSDAFVLSYGPEGATVPAAPPGELLLVVDTTQGTGGGRIGGISELHVTPTSATLTSFSRTAEALGLSVKGGEGTTSLKARDFATLTTTWSQPDALVDLASVGTAGSIAFARFQPSGSTYANLTGLDGGTFRVTNAGGTLSALASEGVDQAAVSRVVSGTPTVLTTTHGGYYDAAGGDLRFDVENLKELTMEAPAASAFGLTLEPTATGFSESPMAFRIEQAPDSAYVRFTPAGSRITLALPRAQAFDVGWSFQATGTDGALAYAAERGETFVELDASDASAPLLNIALGDRIEWTPGTTGKHDVDLRVVSDAGGLDIHAVGLEGDLDLQAGAAFRSGTMTAHAGTLEASWRRGTPAVPAAPTVAQYLLADARADSGLALRLLDARNITWSASPGSVDVHTNASTSGSAQMVMITDQTSAHYRTSDLAGAPMDLHATSSILPTDPRWRLDMPTVPPTFALTYLHGASSFNVTRDATALGSGGEARMSPVSATNVDELAFVTGLSDARVEALWGGDTMRIDVEGAAGDLTLTRTTPDFSSGQITSTTTPTLATIDYLRNANGPYSAPRFANTVFVRTGSAPEVHAKLAGVTAAKWTTNATSFTYNETATTSQTSRFVWANGDRLAYAQRTNSGGAYNASATLREDPGSASDFSYEADSQSAGQGDVSLGIIDTGDGISANVTATAVAGRLQAFAGSASPHVQVIAGGTGSAHGIVTTATTATSFSAGTRSGDQLLQFFPGACDDNGPGTVFKVTSTGQVKDVSVGHSAGKLEPLVEGTNAFVAKCDNTGLHARAVAPLMLPGSAVNVKPCEGTVLEDYVVAEQLALTIPFARGTLSALFEVQGVVPAKMDLTVACDEGKDVRITYALREVGTNTLKPAEVAILSYVDLLPGVPPGIVPCRPMTIGGVCTQSMLIEGHGAPADLTVELSSEPNSNTVTITADKIDSVDFFVQAPRGAEDNEVTKEFNVVSTAMIGRAQVTIKRGHVAHMPEAPSESHHVLHHVVDTGEVMFFRANNVDRVDVQAMDRPSGLFLDLDVNIQEHKPHELVVDWDTSPCTTIWGRALTLPDVDGTLDFHKEVQGDSCSPEGECTGEDETTEALRLDLDLALAGGIRELEFAIDDCEGVSHWQLEDINIFDDNVLRAGRLVAHVDYHRIVAGKADLSLPGQQPRVVLTAVPEDEDAISTIRATIPNRLVVEWDLRDDQIIYAACDTRILQPLAIDFIARDPFGWGFTMGGLGAEARCLGFVLDIEDLNDIAWVWASEKTHIPVAQYRGIACLGLAVETMGQRFPLPYCMGPIP